MRSTSTATATTPSGKYTAPKRARTAGSPRTAATPTTPPTAGKCNDANESVTVTEPKEPDLDVEKTVSRGDEEPSHENSAQPGDVLDYQILVKNLGDAAANDVDVSDDINDILDHATFIECSDELRFGGRCPHLG